MHNTSVIRQAVPRSGSTRFISLLPLWLFALAITAEGFPRPPIPIELAGASFVLALSLSVVSLSKSWTTIEITVFSFSPLLWLYAFDEITTAYKTPFILLCALSLTAGVVAYQSSGSARLARGFILLLVGVITLLLAWHATSNFWQMASRPDPCLRAGLQAPAWRWWAWYVLVSV